MINGMAKTQQCRPAVVRQSKLNPNGETDGRYSDHLKIRIITYAKTRRAFDFSTIGAVPFLDWICTVAGCASA
jgi:hypothetical protein